MSKAKKRNGKGGRLEDSGLGPADFAVGSAKSRAVARMLAGRPGEEPERIEVIFTTPRPRIDNSRPHAWPWYKTDDGKLMRWVYVPQGMDPDVASDELERCPELDEEWLERQGR